MEDLLSETTLNVFGVWCGGNTLRCVIPPHRLPISRGGVGVCAERLCAYRSSLQRLDVSGFEFSVCTPEVSAASRLPHALCFVSLFLS